MSLELAEHGLAHARGDAQVTVRRTRRLVARLLARGQVHPELAELTRVQVLALHDGHTAWAETTSCDDDALHAAARRAHASAEAAAATAPSDATSYPGLPTPAPARAHDGFDRATARLEPDMWREPLQAARALALARRVALEGAWEAVDEQVAIASSTGVRVSDRTTRASLRLRARAPDGGMGTDAGVAVSAGGLDGDAVTRRAADRAGAADDMKGRPAVLAPGEYPVVLDGAVVAELLATLGASAFNGQAHAEGRGALSGRLGTRVAASTINLSDSARFPGTLACAIDAEGVPKAPVPLIQDGVAHRVVHDTRSAALAGEGATSTGHALIAGGATRGPAPRHLVLVGGGADDEHELARPIERGLYLTAVTGAEVVDARSATVVGCTSGGTFEIRNGEIAGPAAEVCFADSVLGVLAGVEALTARPRLVRAQVNGAAVVCPSLRASALRVVGPAR